MKALSIQQRESFHTELQSTSDIVGNFLDKVKEMQAQKEANKKGGKTVSNTKLQSPLNSILNKISKAKAMSVAHRQQASQRSEKFHAMIRLKVDKQSEAMKTIKAHISDVQNAANTVSLSTRPSVVSRMSYRCVKRCAYTGLSFIGGLVINNPLSAGGRPGRCPPHCRRNRRQEPAVVSQH